ncbi:hypothetical protein CDAR_448311, partial [Caerostris darwini]
IPNYDPIAQPALYNLVPNVGSARTDNTTIWRPTWDPLEQTILQSGAQLGVRLGDRQHYIFEL